MQINITVFIQIIHLIGACWIVDYVLLRPLSQHFFVEEEQDRNLLNLSHDIEKEIKDLGQEKNSVTVSFQEYASEQLSQLPVISELEVSEPTFVDEQKDLEVTSKKVTEYVIEKIIKEYHV